MSRGVHTSFHSNKIYCSNEVLHKIISDTAGHKAGQMGKEY